MPKKRLISGMDWLTSQCREDVLWPLSSRLEVQSVRAKVGLVIPDELSGSANLNSLKSSRVAP
jgi:hypothetical protein